MAFKIRELYNELGEVIEKLGDIMGGKVIEENENEYRLVCETSFYYIHKLNINIHNAYLLTYDKDTEDYKTEDCLKLVFDRDKKELVYSEQGGTVQTCIHNYCKLVLKDNYITMKKVDNYNCTFILDKGNVIDSYKSKADISME